MYFSNGTITHYTAMSNHLFGLQQKEYLKDVSVTMLNTDSYALTIKKTKIIRRKAIEFEIQFINNKEQFVINFKGNRELLLVTSGFPLEGIISSAPHDGSLVNKIKMGYFNDQMLHLTEKGTIIISFLINDIINMTNLTKINPGIIIEYYGFIRGKMKKDMPNILENQLINYAFQKGPYANLLADAIRKKHLFSYNGLNMFLSFKGIIENHPELFITSLN